MKREKSCWETNTCPSGFFVFVAVAVVAIVCMTMFVPSLRAPYRSEPELSWWQKTIIYQIYPRSFQDSDGDGTGDLQGIISRLSYFTDLKIGTLWLSPFFRSPMRDFGYDVANYTEVDPIFGSMTDFEQLVKEAHNRGLRVIIDFVPNHTSNESSWFTRSRDPLADDKYKNYYIWHPGNMAPNGTRIPPNNWRSGFGGSAWQWDESRDQFYYHHYLTSQPDLNYRSDDVCNDIDQVLRFWLDRGVDGFRLDAISWLYERSDVTLDERTYSEFIRNQPEVYTIIRRWKSILEEYDSQDGRNRVLIAEGPDRMSSTMRKQYTDAGSQPFFFDLIKAKKRCGATASCFMEIIRQGLNLTEGQWPNFVIGNHDSRRVADRLGFEYADAMNVMLLTLPGTPTTYYGEELGMRDGNYSGLPPRDTKAIQAHDASVSRDPERNPMQWEPVQPYAGFTDCRSVKPGTTCPWLPITENTDILHVNVQTENSSPTSSLAIYRVLADLRTRPAFQNTHIEFPVDTGGDVLAYIRGNESETYAILINLGTDSRVVNLSGRFTGGSVVLTTKPRSSSKINMSSIGLTKGEALVILMT